jgi:hypothetical protein
MQNFFRTSSFYYKFKQPVGRKIDHMGELTYSATARNFKNY